MPAQSELVSFTPNPTGNIVLSLNASFTPSTGLFWVGPRSGVTETISLASMGAVDFPNGNSTSQSNLVDGTGRQTKTTNSACLWHHNRVSGTITKIIEITPVSAGAGTATVNVGTANANYTVYGILFA